MRFPWSKKEEYVMQPEEYLSGEDLERYVGGLERDAKAWKKARGTPRGSLESLSGMYSRYPASEETPPMFTTSEPIDEDSLKKSRWKDFLIRYYYADSNEEKGKAFLSEMHSLMNKGHKKFYSFQLLLKVLAKAGLEPPDFD